MNTFKECEDLHRIFLQKYFNLFKIATGNSKAFFGVLYVSDLVPGLCKINSSGSIQNDWKSVVITNIDLVLYF